MAIGAALGDIEFRVSLTARGSFLGEALLRIDAGVPGERLKGRIALQDAPGKATELRPRDLAAAGKGPGMATDGSGWTCHMLSWEMT